MESIFNSKSKGFSVAKGSDISPSDLLKSGIFMKDSKFHPHNLDTVEHLIFKAFREGKIKTNYLVREESTFLNRIYRFDACPF
ncbi:hypothetical protein ACT7TL_003252 [Vibrio cholerae]